MGGEGRLVGRRDREESEGRKKRSAWEQGVGDAVVEGTKLA